VGAEESILVSQLRGRAMGEGADCPTRQRQAATAVLGALRAGLDCASLLSGAPGLDPATVVAAWERLNAALATATAAWFSLNADPTTNGLAAHGAVAGLLLPAPVGEAIQAASRAGDDGVARVVARSSARAGELERVGLRIEAELAAPEREDAADIARRRALGRTLYDPHQPGLWGHPAFVPARVGMLTSAAVDALWSL